MSTYPPDLAQYIQTKVASGAFRSQDEFAIEAARLYRDLEDRHARLKSDVQAAIDEADRGECEPMDIEAIKAELMAEIDENGQPR